MRARSQRSTHGVRISGGVIRGQWKHSLPARFLILRDIPYMLIYGMRERGFQEVPNAKTASSDLDT